MRHDVGMAIAPDNSALQVFYGSIPLIGAILLSNWRDSKRVEDLKTSLSKRIDGLEISLNKRIDDFREDIGSEMRTGFQDVKERLGKVEDRVTDLEKGLRVVRS
jgi:hypothetical protein